MQRLFYISHPQVRIDPVVPVPQWGLSDVGRQRALKAAGSSSFAGVRSIFSSAEVKAVETAEIFAAALELSVSIIGNMHENERSATGFLPPDEFERVADQFFANPDQSIRGWETACAAQARIVHGIDGILKVAAAGDIIVTGHGGVGTLLYCHHAGLAISRAHDQPAGGGNVISIDRDTGKPMHRWRPLEDF